MGGESTDELEPLFDYHRVQPFHIVCLDDDVSDSIQAEGPKRRKLSDTIVVDEEAENEKDVWIADFDEKGDDDWMPPPPKVSNDAQKFEEDPTIKELRLKKQELASFAKSAEEVLRSVEQSVNTDTATQSAKESVANQPSKFNCERAKVVISIQDKEELKQFRVYKDEKLERLFKMHAEKSKLDLQTLVFCFDGDKINPSATPESLGLEDEDIIEVNIKSR